MQLKAIIDDTAGLSASVLSFYTKQNKGALKGKFVLNVEPVDGFELLEVAPLRDEEQRLASALEKKLVDDAITSAVTAAGGNVALLRPLIAARARLDRASLAVVIADDQGRAYHNLKGEAGDIGDLVEEFRKNPTYARAFDEKPNSDVPAAPTPHQWGDARTLTEYMAAEKARRAKVPEELEIKSNPWCAATRNLTDQMRILKADPSRAAVLRAEAERGLR